MLKKLFILILIIAPFISAAQNKTPIPIPMKNGIIWYEKSYPIKKGLKAPELTKMAMSWFKDNFPDENMTAGNSGELAIRN